MSSCPLSQTACGFMKYVIRACVVFCLNVRSTVESTAAMMPCCVRNLDVKLPFVYTCCFWMLNIAVIAYFGWAFCKCWLVCWVSCLQAPVAVYTAGKTSSGPGLTGSMLKKPNGQFYLEVIRSACMTASCVTTHLECSFMMSLNPSVISEMHSRQS